MTERAGGVGEQSTGRKLESGRAAQGDLGCGVGPLGGRFEGE